MTGEGLKAWYETELRYAVDNLGLGSEERQGLWQLLSASRRMRPGELREQDHTEVWLWSDLHLGHESGNERPARNRRFVEVVQKGRTIEFTHDIARKRKLTLLIEAVHLTAEPETAYPRMTDAVGTLAVHDLTPDDSYYWIIEERDNPTNPRQSSRPWTSRPSSTTSNVEEVLIMTTAGTSQATAGAATTSYHAALRPDGRRHHRRGHRANQGVSRAAPRHRAAADRRR